MQIITKPFKSNDLKGFFFFYPLVWVSPALFEENPLFLMINVNLQQIRLWFVLYSLVKDLLLQNIRCPAGLASGKDEKGIG